MLEDSKHHFFWAVHPELVDLGPFHIRWYGLLFALAFLVGYRIVWGIYKLENKPRADLDRLLIFMMVSTVVGARLGHCFFYESNYYLSRPFEIFKVWRGGLASHGAAIGILLGLYLYSRTALEQPYLWLLSRISIPTALGGCFIRMGNFFNSEILGTPSNVPWAVIFGRVDLLARHPAQLYESLSYLVIFFVLLTVYKRDEGATDPKTLLGLFFLLIFSARFLIEFVKEPHTAIEQTLPLHLGQLLSIPFIILGLLLILLSDLRKETPKFIQSRS